MASSYPGALDSFTNPSSTDAMDASAALYHDVQHANANDAIEAVQAELGTDPAGGAATVKARLELLGLGTERSLLWPTTGISYTSQFGALGSVAVTPNRLFYNPFWCPTSVTTASLIINVTSGVTGNVRLGIYADSYGSTGHIPGSRVVDAGTATTGSSAIRRVTTAQSLTGDTLYWLACVFDAAPTCSRLGVGGIQLTHDGAGPNYYNGQYYEAFTYGALPASAGTLTKATISDGPLIWVEL